MKQSTDKPAISESNTTNNTSSNNDNTNSAKADEYYDDLNNSDGVHTVPEGEDETETVDGIEVIKNPKEECSSMGMVQVLHYYCKRRRAELLNDITFKKGISCQIQTDFWTYRIL